MSDKTKGFIDPTKALGRGMGGEGEGEVWVEREKVWVGLRWMGGFKEWVDGWVEGEGERDGWIGGWRNAWIGGRREKVRDEEYEREGEGMGGWVRAGMSSCGDKEYEFVQVKK